MILGLDRWAYIGGAALLIMALLFVVRRGADLFFYIDIHVLSHLLNPFLEIKNHIKPTSMIIFCTRSQYTFSVFLVSERATWIDGSDDSLGYRQEFENFEIKQVTRTPFR